MQSHKVIPANSETHRNAGQVFSSFHFFAKKAAAENALDETTLDGMNKPVLLQITLRGSFLQCWSSPSGNNS